MNSKADRAAAAPSFLIGIIREFLINRRFEMAGLQVEGKKALLLKTALAGEECRAGSLRCLSHLLGVFLLLHCFAVPFGAHAQSWSLAWSDEFNGQANSPINSATWQFDTGILNVNNEVEYYCAPGSNTSPCNANQPNAYIDGNGHLVIQAFRINSGTAPYSGSWTSARLNSGSNLKSFQYGRLESSMSLPIGPGLWPAYWALGGNINTVGWPSCGEMDFMENVPASSGLGPTVVASHIHGGAASNNCYCGANGIGKNYAFPANDPNGPDVTSFHTYGGIWSPYMVQFYVDDPANVFLVITASDIPPQFAWEFNHPFFVLLNLAVGGTGSWPGPSDNMTPSPAVMQVDYVRWYTPSAVAGPTMGASPISVKAGQNGSTNVNLSSLAGTGRVYLSCATNAPKASCSINSGDSLDQYTVDFSKAATGQATLNVSTTASTSGARNNSAPGKRTGAMAGLFEVLVAIVLPLGSNRRFRGLAGLCIVAFILLLWPGCGGSSSANSGGGGGGGGNGTPPGNYSVTINAYTVSNAGVAPDSTTSVGLTVN